MDKKIIRNYARLIAVSGVHVKNGQEVVVSTCVETSEFAEMLVEELYLAGASRVVVEWSWQPITRLHVRYQNEETLSLVRDYDELKLRRRSETLPAYVHILSEDPDGLAGMDQEKWARVRQAQYKITKPYSDAMENKYQWCVAAVPGLAWARKVFPDLRDEEAMEKLWEAILNSSRAMGKDPVKDWQTHDENLRRRCEYLNSLGLRRLKYTSQSTGTDFSVGLIPNALFVGGSEKLPGTDLEYNPNIPSEEVFTTPMRGDAEGILYATRPLSYRGILIENFSVRFEKGKVVEAKAEKNEDVLRQMVSMDEGASMLGECALVPFHSPIQESGILFYNTLFDENASCHMALGSGYSVCLPDYDRLSPEQARDMGVNDSMIHEDFMIGSEDLCITGIREDGSKVTLFRNGDWV